MDANREYTLQERLEKWASQTVEAIRLNFRTQHVFPAEVYPGYFSKNLERRKQGKAGTSTGAAYEEIYFFVRDAAQGDTAKIDFFFKNYLYFVDMGVGAGRKANTIETGRNAVHTQRYGVWSGVGDRQSRPVINMEMRHQVRRLTMILERKYAWTAQLRIVYGLEGVTDREQ